MKTETKTCSIISNGILLARLREAYFRHVETGRHLHEHPLGKHRVNVPRRCWEQDFTPGAFFPTNRRTDGSDIGLVHVRQRENARQPRVQVIAEVTDVGRRRRGRVLVLVLAVDAVFSDVLRTKNHTNQISHGPTEKYANINVS